MSKLFKKIVSGALALTMVSGCLATTSCQFLDALTNMNQSSTSEGDSGETSKTLSSIAVSKAPTKVEYYSGETFSPAGMELTATYSDNSTEVIKEGYTYRPDGALTKADNSIEITYQNKKTMLPITVVDKEIVGTTYSFEAENAKLEGTVNANTYKGQPLACYNIVDQAHASGGKMINNMNKEGNVISWTVESDKVAEAKLIVNVAVRCSKSGGVLMGWNVEFDDMYTTTVNGKRVEVAATVTPKNGDGQPATEYTYYELCPVSVNINLEQGTNVIALTVGAEEKAGNLDGIQLVTDATLTDKTNGVKHTESAWMESSKPTAIAEGLLTKGCTVCGKASSEETVVLPVLTSDTQFYTYELTKKATEDETGLETYTYTKDGQTFTYTVALPKLAPGVAAFDPQWVGSELFGEVNFFDPTHWTEGKQPALDTDGSIKVTSNARIDYLGKYVDGAKYNPAHDDAKHDILDGTELIYSMQLKSTGNFGIMLFSTSSATWTNNKNRAIFMEFNNGTITFKGSKSNSGVGGTSVLTNYSFTEYTRVDFVVSRYVDTEGTKRFSIKLYVAGQQVDMTGTNINEEGAYRFSLNGFGGYLEFVSLDGSVLNINVPEANKYKAEA